MSLSNFVDPCYDDWEKALAEGQFEDAMAALEEIVRHLESGNLRLADAIRCYEIGNKLSRRCEQMLNEAELRITQLDADQDDSTQPNLRLLTQ